MAKSGKGGQTAADRRSSSTEEVIEQPVVDEETAERKERLDEDIDGVLDEIDEVLEENAEEFVRGFVQKGGQ